MTSRAPLLRLPRMPCDACLADPMCCKEGRHVAAVYCSHHRTGMHVHAGLFALYSPIGPAEYAEIVAQLELRLAHAMPSAAAN